jgi:hypothetical protein
MMAAAMPHSDSEQPHLERGVKGRRAPGVANRRKMIPSGCANAKSPVRASREDDHGNTRWSVRDSKPDEPSKFFLLLYLVFILRGWTKRASLRGKDGDLFGWHGAVDGGCGSCPGCERAGALSV